MRYEARHAPGHGEGWDVVDTANPCRGLIAENVEEAEASIIQFALNAVADGSELHAEAMEGVKVKYHRCIRQYDGPTEGVAP